MAGATHKELAAQVRYLKVENEILRSKLPKRVSVTETERNRLIKFAATLGKSIGALVTIVHPDTLKRWIREASQRRTLARAKTGRPKSAEEIQKLIVKFATENSWGYTRVLGELRKLGIHSVSRNTVKNILKANGLEPGPQRGEGTWDEFLKRHASSLWQCDFFSKNALTLKGPRDLFVLVFLHVETRRVFLSPATQHPNEAWVREQAQAFMTFARENDLAVSVVLHDRDSKFSKAFDHTLKDAQVRIVKASFRSPNLCAFVERFIQTMKQGVLDYFIVFGERHLNYLLHEAQNHYHTERPHQGKGNTVLMHLDASKAKPLDDSTADVLPIFQLRCRQRLGGLLKPYYRKAA